MVFLEEIIMKRNFPQSDNQDIPQLTLPDTYFSSSASSHEPNSYGSSFHGSKVDTEYFPNDLSQSSDNKSDEKIVSSNEDSQESPFLFNSTLTTPEIYSSPLKRTRNKDDTKEMQDAFFSPVLHSMGFGTPK